MPAFWEYPLLPMIPYTIDSYQTPCHNKTKSKLIFVTNLQKKKLLNFSVTFTLDTPSEVVW